MTLADRRIRLCVALLGALTLAGVVAPRALSAQNDLTLSLGTTYTFAIPKVSEFTASPTPATIPVTLKFGITPTSGGTFIRHETVQIRCTATTGGRPCSDYQWSWSASGIWTDFTASFVDVHTYDITKNGPGDPTADNIFLRKKLSWVNDVPGTYSVTVQTTISVWHQ